MTLKMPWWRLVIYWAAATAIILASGALLIAVSGVYNVAASAKHLPITRWFLELGMSRSVRLHSALIEAPPLDDENLVKLGLGHYHGGCLPCHGAPGVRANPIVKHMLPSPPRLETHIPNWDDAELFWIVKHGIKYAGMPSWVAQQRDDEVWAVAAFLRQLPEMPAARYAALSRGNIPQQAQPLSLLPAQGAQDVNIAACLRCHDGEGKAPTNTLTPRLAGQKRDYLATALKQYSSGARPSGIMQPIAAELKDDEIAALADHYAQLEPTPPYPEEATASQEIMERGRKLFTLGEPEKGVPACQTCHRKETRQSYPLLAGQSVKYITGQLQLWKKYGRSDVPQDAIMEAIAKRLKPEQIAAVSAYIATLPPFDAPQTVSASGQTNGSAPAATTK